MTPQVGLISGAVLFYAAAATLFVVNLLLGRRVTPDGDVSGNSCRGEHENVQSEEELPRDRNDANRDRLDAAIVCLMLATVFAVSAAGL
ncbi:hypothetical protein [Rhodococcus sp. NBC_00297]|uniref:hypothetical protein n=1 Tax=Rhodococcus sp. NBC_00297 TaxID=2976005 RepID=UPI002E28B134|nr:hypothetical protein [Rhodococcus sp. NBC_00297]